LIVLLVLTSFAAHAIDGDYLIRRYGRDPSFAANVRVQMIGQRLARAAGLRNVVVQVYNSGEINAMAFPDGHVYVGAGMAHLATDDELAFILGHEMTHVKEHHSVLQVLRAVGGAVVGGTAVVLLGGGPTAARVGADIAGGVTFGLNSRADERRSDEQGMRLAARAGFDPAQSVAAMTRIRNAYGNGGARTWLTGLFASHPDTTWRVKNLQAAVDGLAAKPVAALPPPALIALSLDPSAQHGRTWMPSYLALQLYTAGEGGLYVQASPEEAPIFGQAPEVQPPSWRRAPDVTAILAVREVPAGGADTLEAAAGTAVEASIAWTHPASGQQGTLTAIAQTRRAVPWTAQEQTKDTPGAIQQLDTGRQRNVEGTLEAEALRRVGRMLAAVALAGPPVAQAPVTLRCYTKRLRVNDTLAISNGVRIIAEVRVDRIDGPRRLTGTVLWGASSFGRGTYIIDPQE
jgi:hypothetical protein